MSLAAPIVDKYIGKGIAKLFAVPDSEDGEQALYLGSVVSKTEDTDGVMYRVKYEDDDEEDMEPGDELDQLDYHMSLYALYENESKAAAIRKAEMDAANEVEEDEEDGKRTDTPVTDTMDDSSDDDYDPPQKKSEDVMEQRRSSPRCPLPSASASKSTSGKKTKQSSLSSFFAKSTSTQEKKRKQETEMGNQPSLKKRKAASPARSSPRRKSEPKIADTEMESSPYNSPSRRSGSARKAVSSLDDVVEAPKKKKAGKKKTNVSEEKTAFYESFNDESEYANARDNEFFECVAKESYSAKSSHAGFDSRFVEPVGVDPTDEVVENLIYNQVKKIGQLLIDAIGNGDMAPVRLQTACSGTDGPSIALTLVKEVLDRLVKDHGFKADHVMSCEIEAFKQAYLARNFPGVNALFPDIVKLTGSDLVADVYGRQQRVPEGNLFVAGTSCKDFSSQKSHRRKDIEDRGQSGETFLAAVEFLEKFGPEMAIFENVQGAPWGKMIEYISGVVALDRMFLAGKAVGIGAEKSTELKFAVDEYGNYVVEKVGRQVGCVAGAKLQGYVRDGDGKVRALKSDKKEGTIVTVQDIIKTHKLRPQKLETDWTKYAKQTKADKYNPNERSDSSDWLVFEKNHRYRVHYSKIDSKEFGICQTRNRGYLFVWRSDNLTDDLGEYYEEILRFLQVPLTHSIEAFFLPAHHDRLRQFREALRSGPGMILAKNRMRDPDFWDWSHKNLDTPRHFRFRADNNIDLMSRWITGWGDNRQRVRVAPGVMPELVNKWNSRRHDMIDCFAAAAARDSIPRDALHHSFTWDISQNVTRAQHRPATLGTTGCVTPAGELFIPHLGRNMLGYEKLLLQGIPYSRLMLGNESECQISDLAGNAMTLPVVCATMLAAITAKQLRREREGSSKNNGVFSLAKHAGLAAVHDEEKGGVVPSRGDLFSVDIAEAIEGSAADSFKSLLDLADKAYDCSVLCNCESSGQNTSATVVVCSGCGLSICQNCSDMSQVASHDLREKHRFSPRECPRAFEHELRRRAPATLSLGKGSERYLKNGSALESYSFKLLQVVRLSNHWQLVYGAKEDFGNGRQVAEIRVRIGKLETLSDTNGLLATIKCFAPAIRDSPKRGKLPLSAKLELSSSISSTIWKVPSNTKKSHAKISGSGSSPSFRKKIGINEGAAKCFSDAQAPSAKRQEELFEGKHRSSRNSFLKYDKFWDTWPQTIEISEAANELVNGTYERLPCDHSVVFSALWRRSAMGNSPAMYIYCRPEIGRLDVDVYCISPSPNYRDGAEVAELVDWIPENALSKKFQSTEIKYIQWTDEQRLEVNVLSGDLAVESPPSFSPTSDGPLSLCTIKGLHAESLSAFSGKSESDGSVLVDLVGSTGVQNTKRLTSVAAPVLLKHASEHRLPLNVGDQWYSLTAPDKTSFGRSDIHIPPRPLARWSQVRDKVFERLYDAKASNDYYLAFHNRPKSWSVTINGKKGELDICVNPFVVAHHAAASLIKGLSEKEEVETSYRLAELSSMEEPSIKVFKVPNSDSYQPTALTKSDGMLLDLYPRQAKALTRMLSIENGDVQFAEEEQAEETLPGVGWCLIGRASRTSKLRGGVLGDAIGSGKTVITIALILARVAEARRNIDVNRGISAATLIVVPPGLIDQWDDERKKFTGNKLKCLKIADTKALVARSIKDICEADIIIVPVNILEGGTSTSRPYTENIKKKSQSGLTIPHAPKHVSQREAPSIEGTWIRNQSSGPDMYVGNKTDQRKREALAYYSHCYEKNIEHLRRRQDFTANDRGVPLEWFTFFRVVVDECHETLITAKKDNDLSDLKAFTETHRRGAREFLGVGQTYDRRPLRSVAGFWGLTGTPMLETEARVMELANLMGGTYVTGAAHHWRREERDSGRDMFLNLYEGTRSRAYRSAVQAAAHKYVAEACQRNRGEKLQVELRRTTTAVSMTQSESSPFLKAVSNATGGSSSSYAFNLSEVMDADRLRPLLELNARSKARQEALVSTIQSIHSNDDAGSAAKIIVFADVLHGGYDSACQALGNGGIRYVAISEEDTIERQNEKISWFRHIDVTSDEKSRPRVLVLNFEQAAGHNLQAACHNVILYEPKYSGGADALADVSVEEQAIGRVYRQGQSRDVNLVRIALTGPDGETSIDDWIIKRNTDENILQQATSNFD